MSRQIEVFHRMPQASGAPGFSPRNGGSNRAEHAMEHTKQISSNRSPWMVLNLLVAVLLFGSPVLASVTASISGAVKDPSGAAVVGATVTATNVETGIEHTLHSNAQGYYSFQELPLGHYNIKVQQTGFKTFLQTGLVLDVNAALVVDVTLI